MAYAVFQWREISEALAHAADGGQAIHLHRIVFSSSPACFKQAVSRGEDIAHLFDLDRARLIKTAKRLGVRVIRIDKDGTENQHIDLCGAPLRRLLAEIKNADQLRIGSSETGSADGPDTEAKS